MKKKLSSTVPNFIYQEQPFFKKYLSSSEDAISVF